MFRHSFVCTQFYCIPHAFPMHYYPKTQQTIYINLLMLLQVKKIFLVFLLCLILTSSQSAGNSTQPKNGSSDSNAESVEHYLQRTYNLTGYHRSSKQPKETNSTGTIYVIRYDDSHDNYFVFQVYLGNDGVIEVKKIEGNKNIQMPLRNKTADPEVPIVEVNSVSVIEDHLQKTYNMTGYFLHEKYIEDITADGMNYFVKYIGSKGAFIQFKVYLSYQGAVKVKNIHSNLMVNTLAELLKSNRTLPKWIDQDLRSKYDLLNCTIESQSATKQINGTLFNVEYVDNDSKYRFFLIHQVSAGNFYEVRKFIRLFSQRFQALERIVEGANSNQIFRRLPKIQKMDKVMVTLPGKSYKLLRWGTFKHKAIGLMKMRQILKSLYPLEGYYYFSSIKNKAQAQTATKYDITFKNFLGDAPSFLIIDRLNGKVQVLESSIILDP